jgi:hypothetical protein
VSFAALYLAHPTRWWTMPWRVIRAIRDRRTMIPSPLIYIAALVTGALVGVALDALVGWQWWMVALVFLFLVWLAFLSSAFIGPMRGPSLRDELLDAIHPGTRLERMQQRDERMIRNCPFSLFGLDSSWTGLRWIGGSGSDGKTLSSLQLAFGDHFSMDPWLRIDTSTADEGREFDLRYWAIELWRRAERPPRDLPSHQWIRWEDRRIEEHLAKGANWSKVSIPVDGSEIPFDCLEEEADWVARAPIGDVVVVIEAHRFPIESVRLVTVTDVEPYIEGSRRYFDEQRNLHGDEEN